MSQSGEPTTSYESPSAMLHAATVETDSQMLSGRAAALILILMVILSDVSLYHAAGYTGPAVFLIGAGILFCVGIPKRRVSAATVVLAVLLLILAWRMTGNGWWLQIVAGIWLLSGLILTLHGCPPFVLETVSFGVQALPGGHEFLSRLNDRLQHHLTDSADSGHSRRMDYLLPAAAAMLFGSLFVMANPDLADWFSDHLGRFTDRIREFLFQFSATEVVFWCFVIWITGGLLRPVAADSTSGDIRPPEPTLRETPLYFAYRNTLVTVSILFAGYLVFEFRTLWFREFPEGFHYSGYAHEGAAWLTAALALATCTLSVIFRGDTLTDSRLPQLKKFAWLWSFLNLLLAVAVHHRLFIYIDFNGMTRMRTIGLLGITAVVGGFLLVVRRINRHHGFQWLLRRQLWVVAALTWIYLVLPVDDMVHRYNVSQILAGHHAPVVQITGHPVDDEALPALLPLCDAEDELIRSGIRAFLSQRFVRLQATQQSRRAAGWTAWQRGSETSLRTLQNSQESWDVFSEDLRRDAAWQQLQDEAYRRWW